MRSALLIICLLFLVGALGQPNPLLVQTTNGPVLGISTISTWTTKTMYTFLGVPFAAPPVADLRFKLPVSPPTWDSPLDCTQFRNSCMQTNSSWFPGLNEDCLYLNVYSPDLAPIGDLSPVYIWIHGGGFNSGTAAWYHPDKFVEEGIVVITVNYRLGVFGFLNLGTADAPGNMGLFDNIMAMKWVQREISKFGGNPDKVTIGGSSAGSMISHLHYLSPASKGLFHQVIGESGASLAFAVTEYASEYANRLAVATNCTSVDVISTEQCLRDLTADVLLSAQNKVGAFSNESIRGNIVPWVATVDKDTNIDNPFLPEMPMKLMENKQGSSVPFMMGTNRDEGTLMVMYTALTDSFLSYFTSNMKYVMSPDLLYYSSQYEIDQKLKDIKAFYFNGQDPSTATIKGYIDLYTDIQFAYVTAVSARYFHERNKVFLYEFEFHGNLTPSSTKTIEDRYNLTLVGHGDELSFLFFQNSNMVDGSIESTTLQRMVKLWSNFIKFGTPTPSPDPLLQNVSWTPLTPVTDSFSGYLHISDNLTMVEEGYKLDSVKLWDSVYNVQTSTALPYTTQLTPNVTGPSSAASRLHAFVIVAVMFTVCKINLEAYW